MNYSQCPIILLPLLVFHPYLRAWTSNLEQSICANKYTVSKGFRADNVNYRLWIIFRAPNWFEERENKLIVLSRLLGWPLNFLAESKEKKVCHLCLSFRSKLPSGIGVGRRNNGFPFAWLLWDTRKKKSVCTHSKYVAKTVEKAFLQGKRGAYNCFCQNKSQWPIGRGWSVLVAYDNAR